MLLARKKIRQHNNIIILRTINMQIEAKKKTKKTQLTTLAINSAQNSKSDWLQNYRVERPKPKWGGISHRTLCISTRPRTLQVHSQPHNREMGRTLQNKKTSNKIQDKLRTKVNAKTQTNREYRSTHIYIDWMLDLELNNQITQHTWLDKTEQANPRAEKRRKAHEIKHPPKYKTPPGLTIRPRFQVLQWTSRVSPQAAHTTFLPFW